MAKKYIQSGPLKLFKSLTNKNSEAPDRVREWRVVCSILEKRMRRDFSQAKGDFFDWPEDLKNIFQNTYRNFQKCIQEQEPEHLAKKFKSHEALIQYFFGMLKNEIPTYYSKENPQKTIYVVSYSNLEDFVKILHLSEAEQARLLQFIEKYNGEYCCKTKDTMKKKAKMLFPKFPPNFIKLFLNVSEEKTSNFHTFNENYHNYIDEVNEDKLTPEQQADMLKILLDKEERKLLEWYNEHSISKKEIANRLGCSIGKVNNDFKKIAQKIIPQIQNATLAIEDLPNDKKHIICRVVFRTIHKNLEVFLSNPAGEWFLMRLVKDTKEKSKYVCVFILDLETEGALWTNMYKFKIKIEDPYTDMAHSFDFPGGAVLSN